MKLFTYCDSCRRESVCTAKIKELKNQDFQNIVIIAHCDDLLLPINTAVGIQQDGTIREVFNHCDDCDFASKCKYYKHPEMLKEIDRVTDKCIKNGYKRLEYTCNMHNPINSSSIENTDIDIKNKKWFNRKPKKNHK